MIENELCVECRPGLIAFYPVEISVFYLQKVCVDRKVTPLSRRLMVCGPVTMRRHATRFRFNFSNILELISDGIFIREAILHNDAVLVVEAFRCKFSQSQLA
jgi:hypothetical protein